MQVGSIAAFNGNDSSINKKGNALKSFGKKITSFGKKIKKNVPLDKLKKGKNNDVDVSFDPYMNSTVIPTSTDSNQQFSNEFANQLNS